jgi:hypothetical protein
VELVLTGYDVLLGSKKCIHASLLDIGIIFLDFILEPESDNQNTSVIVRESPILVCRDCFSQLLKVELALIAVDVANASVTPLRF